MTNRTELNAMIAGFLKTRTIDVVEPHVTGTWGWTDERWAEQVARKHRALDMAAQVNQEPIEVREFGLTGEQHGLVFAYYLADDEDLSDVTDLDTFAHKEWVEEAVLGAHHDEAADRNPYW